MFDADPATFLAAPATGRVIPPAASELRAPVPPFTAETAARKARLAEDAWNSRDPVHIRTAWRDFGLR